MDQTSQQHMDVPQDQQDQVDEPNNFNHRPLGSILKSVMSHHVIRRPNGLTPRKPDSGNPALGTNEICQVPCTPALAPKITAKPGAV